MCRSNGPEGAVRTAGDLAAHLQLLRGVTSPFPSLTLSGLNLSYCQTGTFAFHFTNPCDSAAGPVPAQSRRLWYHSGRRRAIDFLIKQNAGGGYDEMGGLNTKEHRLL